MSYGPGREVTRADVTYDWGEVKFHCSRCHRMLMVNTGAWPKMLCSGCGAYYEIKLTVNYAVPDDRQYQQLIDQLELVPVIPDVLTFRDERGSETVISTRPPGQPGERHP